LKNILKYGFYIISLVLTFTVAVPQSNCFAQNQLKIFEDIGGSGTSTNGSGDTDNTFIYVAGGLLVAGILAYAFLVKKDKKNETDTTSVSKTSNLINTSMPEEPFFELTKAKQKIPVDFFFGIRNDEAALRSKTYLLGISLKL
jgi:hypothetical protein